MKNSFIFVGALLLIGVSVNYLEQILHIVALIAIAVILLAVVVGFVFLSFNYIKRDKASSPDVTVKEKREDEPLTDRRVMALYKLAQQVLDDDAVDIDEAEKLRSWFRRYPESADDHRTMHLFGFVEEVLADKKLDDVEALDLFVYLSEFCDQYEAERVKQGKAKLVQVQKPNFDHPQLRQLNDIKLNKEYFMEYENFSGDRSTRNIILKSVKISNSNEPTIGAYCKLRNASRTFRVDRIKSLCSADTGEVFL